MVMLGHSLGQSHILPMLNSLKKVWRLKRWWYREFPPQVKVSQKLPRMRRLQRGTMVWNNNNRLKGMINKLAKYSLLNKLQDRRQLQQTSWHQFWDMFWNHVIRKENHPSVEWEMERVKVRLSRMLTRQAWVPLKEVSRCQHKRCANQRWADTPLPGFVSSSKVLLKEENDLPHARTKEGFDPNAYKLMERAGYDFQNPATLGKVIKVKPHGLNETQKVIHDQGGSVGVSKVELGYTPLKPIRISGQRKSKQSAVQYIFVEEIDGSENEDDPLSTRASIFDRL